MNLSVLPASCRQKTLGSADETSAARSSGVPLALRRFMAPMRVQCRWLKLPGVLPASCRQEEAGNCPRDVGSTLLGCACSTLKHVVRTHSCSVNLSALGMLFVARGKVQRPRRNFPQGGGAVDARVVDAFEDGCASDNGVRASQEPF